MRGAIMRGAIMRAILRIRVFRSVFRLFAVLLPWLIFGACKTPPPTDFKQQKLLQIAILPGARHPAAHRRIQEGIAEAMSELSQVNAVIWRSPQSPAPSAKNSEVQQIIEQGFDVLVLLGDPLVNMDTSLLAAREAGLLVIYCGFAPHIQNPGEATRSRAQTESHAGSRAKTKTGLSTNQRLVHLNILPASRAALQGRVTRLLHSRSPALLLFGPSELPSTQRLYHQLGPVIRANRDRIQAVHFLNPFRIESADQLRRAVLELPPSGQIIALEPLLLYSSAQILQRYSLGTKIAGLGRQDLSDSLLAGGRIEILIPLRHRVLSYAAIYAAFALHSAQKQGNQNELFLLGKYGQRRLTEDGVLVVGT